MWYIFPQYDGLGFSSTSIHYAIKSLDEVRAYLAHPVLGPRLRECVDALLAVNDRSAHQIFGSPDDLKLKSSMTLFAHISPEGSAFERVLDGYFEGRRDGKTLELIRGLAGKEECFRPEMISTVSGKLQTVEFGS
jgi:uncharacterized protein (DUF1810 family)